jgi:hypothetical protein
VCVGGRDILMPNLMIGLTYYVGTVACILYPQVMKKAQDELDSVVGVHRLPDFEDFDSLPYIQALIRECLRLVEVIFVSYHLYEPLFPGGTRFLLLACPIM